MAHVLPFRRRPESRFRSAEPADGPAKIIIFPGVRYERADDQRPERAEPPTGRTRTKRQRAAQSSGPSS